MIDTTSLSRNENELQQTTRCPFSEIEPLPRHWFRNLGSRVLAFALFAMLFPIMLLVGVLIRLTSRGPAIYRQLRLGIGGRQFELYKFRTMIADAEAMSGPVWAAQFDDRITPVGRVLRSLKLDELPQLVNVLRGDMVIVGPRPERPEIAADLQARIPDYRARLVVHPGITGLAQINLPSDTNMDSVRRKLKLDLEYIQAANSWLDLRIVVATLPRLLGRTGKPVARLLCVHRQIEEPLDNSQLAARKLGSVELAVAGRNTQPNDDSAQSS